MRRVLGRAHLGAFASWVDAFRYRQSVRRFLEVAKLRRSGIASSRRRQVASRDARRRLIKTSAISRRCARGADGPSRVRRVARGDGGCDFRRAIGKTVDGARACGAGCFSAWRPAPIDARGCWTSPNDASRRRGVGVSRVAQDTAKTNGASRKLSRAPWRGYDRVCAAAFDAWLENARTSLGHRRALEKMLGQWRLSRVGSAFRGWIEAVEEAARSGRLVAKALARASGRAAAAAFHRWIDALEDAENDDASARARRFAASFKPRRSRRVQGVGRRHQAVQRSAAWWRRSPRDGRVWRSEAFVLGSSRRGSAEGAPRGGRSPRDGRVWRSPKPSRVGLIASRICGGAPRGGEDRREMVAFGAHQKPSPRADIVEDLRRSAAWWRRSPRGGRVWRSRRAASVLGSSRRGSRRERRVVEKIAARWSRLALAEAFACWRKMHAKTRRRRGEAVAAHAMAVRSRVRRRLRRVAQNARTSLGHRRALEKISVGGVSVGSGARFRGGSKRWRAARLRRLVAKALARASGRAAPP